MLVQQFESLKKQTNTTFIYPQYSDSCISQIPNTILHLLGAENQKTKSPFENGINITCPEGISKVVLLVIDGFGFNQFLNYIKPIEQPQRKAEAFPLTSVFLKQQMH
jgi:hypothetical protein